MKNCIFFLYNLNIFKVNRLYKIIQAGYSQVTAQTEITFEHLFQLN